MITSKNNDRLTRVEGDAPLGQMLRNEYWIPFARSEGVKPGAPPQKVRLLGQDFVTFRSEDGVIGLMDERCPHRLASLLLARVEGCTLRCIYHGWRLDASGAVVEVPSEGDRSDEFAARVTVNRYQTMEGGGLIWAYLGQEATAPPPPTLPFMTVPADSRWWARMTVKCNWLQGFEGALDSVHINWLHSGYSAADSQSGHSALRAAVPRYEIEETDYGLRTAAIRELSATNVHFRVAEFVAPFYALSASRQPVVPTDCSVFISVPVDDETHLLFFGFWDEGGPVQDVTPYFPGEPNLDDLFADKDTTANAWGQDRAAMEAGHFSGFTTSVLHEDLGVQLSMGPIADRSREQLCSTDLAIVRTRRFLLDLIKRHEAGGAVDGALSAYGGKRTLPFSCVSPAGSDWRREGMRKVVAA
jgi:phthalate 4,5-dioxygenase